MSGAAFILLINLAVAGLFCATFVLIAFYSRYESARWFAAAYAAGMVHLGLEATLPTLDDARVGVLLGAMAFLCALLFLNVGLARRYDIEAPRTLLTAAFAVSLVVIALTLGMERGSMLRMALYQAPFAAMQAIGAGIVMAAGRRRLADSLLAGFMTLSALHFLAKPVVSVLVGGPGASPQDYLGTSYAMFSQSMGTILSVATALLLLAMLIADLVKDITAKSETDILSGLLNRRGFEQRLEEALRRSASNGLPVSLVICDLDHFKDVNDTYGHAIGDRIIALFAATLRENAADHHVLGRIGGEEFAIMLPGSNLAAGRLFAENARGAFSGLESERLPVASRFTASFGVAEMSHGEVSVSLMARADAALYEAKRAGRDCVRVARVEQIIDDGRSITAGAKAAK
ncbi:GGDEF domain-containing protein [Mesorhizobium microcysteis]|uniref:diguanylate cyclase n=1 Tax=Neoaquamicrobium microcysteis TaxID=2682781 RepID=A0A5D4GUE0_9HYPH|nr:GGDEF domain-containing protein [Mesorhizobium microcysteis]TYR31409.1 GGDEF domain-containing protein [Mesorhizobium microcysteis]